MSINKETPLNMPEICSNKSDFSFMSISQLNIPVEPPEAKDLDSKLFFVRLRLLECEAEGGGLPLGEVLPLTGLGPFPVCPEDFLALPFPVEAISPEALPRLPLVKESSTPGSGGR